MSAAPAFEPATPAFAGRVRASFARQGIMDHIGATLGEVTPGRVEIRLPYREDLSQQHGYFHGGVVSTIADSACGYAGFTLMPEGASVLTVEYKVNFLAPAHGELLVARGEVVKPGRTLVIAQAEVIVVLDGRERACALMTETMMVMHGKEEKT